MENKYYELIIENIKAHRKFVNLDDILEEIAEDVYQHSITVLKSVDDQNIIEAYLNKVITTSLITVPKKLNRNSRNSSKTSELIQQIESSIEQKHVKTIEENFDLEVSTNEEELTAIQDEVIETVEEKIDEPVDFTESTETTPITSEEDVQTDFEETPISTDKEDVDRNLVDLMINGVSNTQELETAVNNSFDNFEVVEDTEIDELELITTETEEINEETIEESEIVEEVENLDTVEEIENFDEVEMIDEIDETNELEINEPNEDVDILNEDPVVELEADTVVDIEATVPQSEQNSLAIDDDIIETFETEIDTLDEIETLDTFDSLEELEVIEEISDVNIDPEISEIQSNNTDFTPPNFKCFDFNPEHLDIDEADIVNEIEDLSKKYSTHKIKEIFELRFEEKLPISEIAAKLDINEADIIESLNDLEDIVKD